MNPIAHGFFQAIIIVIITSSFAIEEGQSPVTIGVTLFPLDDWCRAIAPEGTSVSVLAARGENPSIASPDLMSLKEIYRSRIFIRFGYGLDDWVDRLMPESCLNAETLLILEDAHREMFQTVGEPDSLLENVRFRYDWVDPIWAQDSIRAIADYLKERMPDSAEAIENRTQTYLFRLAELHLHIAKTVSTLTTRDYLSFGHSFEPFAQRYGFKPVAVIHRSGASFPQWKQIRQTIPLTQPSILVIESRDRKETTPFTRGTACHPVEFNLFGAPGQSYLDLMTANLQSLAEGFNRDTQ